MFFDPVVTIPKPTWRRLELLVAELAYIDDGRELDGYSREANAQELVRRIVDEYVREYFEESTRTAATLLSRKEHDNERKGWSRKVMR